MITTALVYFAGLLINVILLAMSPLAGSNGFPVGVDSAVSNAASYMGRANTFISLADVKIIIMFVIVFELTVAYFYIMRWLFGFLPFVGGRG